VSSIKYRKDIDGLRALAILSVIIFHAAPLRLPGGYVGVDIFFVISGFLITSIIKRSIESGNFSLRTFYLRRVRRLFPALCLVLAACMGVGWLVLVTHEFTELGKHVAGGVGFISNLVLYSEAGYFDTQSELKPLLHLWSLGIEEQFYIFFPILLLCLSKMGTRLLHVIIAFTLCSFALNVFAYYSLNIEQGFYLPQFRFWEIGIGAIIAYRPPSLQIADIRQNLFSIVGLALIVIAVLFISPSSRFPGFWALLPTIGTALLLISPSSRVNKYILSNRLAVNLGLISYPLYLWHWPILSFLHIFGENTFLARGLAVLLSIALAYATYTLIEKRVARQAPNATWKPLLAISLLLCIAGISINRQALPARHNSPEMLQALAAVGDWEGVTELEKITRGSQEFSYLKGGGEKTVLFWGDSHLEQYVPRIKYLIDVEQKRISNTIYATGGGIPPIPGVYNDIYPIATPNWHAEVIKLALSDEVDSVVLGGAWARYLLPLPGDRYHYYYESQGSRDPIDNGGYLLARKALAKIIKDISSQKTVFVILDNPADEAFSPKVSASWNRLFGDNYSPMDKGVPVTIDPANQILTEIAIEAGATVIDPATMLLHNGKYRVLDNNGKPIFKDSDHIRPYYIVEHAKFIDELVWDDESL
jgi:peptidoglycan/LPS O-acetylase OafA/YrhL